MTDNLVLPPFHLQHEKQNGTEHLKGRLLPRHPERWVDEGASSNEPPNCVYGGDIKMRFLNEDPPSLANPRAVLDPIGHWNKGEDAEMELIGKFI